MCLGTSQWVHHNAILVVAAAEYRNTMALVASNCQLIAAVAVVVLADRPVEEEAAAAVEAVAHGFG